MEHLRTTDEQDWSGDARLIADGIEHAILEERQIEDGVARIIASQLHSGQRSALYEFTSTGSISRPELFFEELGVDYKILDDETRWNIDALMVYALGRVLAGEVDAKDGWASLWGETEFDDNRCAACREHFANPHAIGCPLDSDDYLED
ncbi:hypothetical protein [Rhodococcus qingshengii]|uniref:hypothetical protein n=1 Tax=Rhodococcus qingshengii TaxID=334542 RepID=UPI002943743B|nr:hypothetical protein [Rhodococcus qingshengii]WOI85955.1 hypothetical protein R0122_22510 [Rhodococcus qingshengii]